ncbi:MAG: ABC transporter ATP-binding protein [Gammaproteobacteria bacterium]|nr:ABC transporter ATP-binding protein [Gammaproteobacteria bacterium]MCY4277185.1 ABC transporter ATP-binding protein [Gammaproteobacteria bacterium]
MTRPLLEVEDLAVEFDTHGGTVKAVRGVSFALHEGQTLAVVGESGCGKSVCVQSLVGLVPMPPGRITSGSARLDGEQILGRETVGGMRVRGQLIGMIFQDPMTSLNPTMRIGDQIAEPLHMHQGMRRRDARMRAIELLELSQVGEAEKRSRQYPFEFSGGMLQRVMIACALACEPRILIADEPTTALDVTIQAQILSLMRDLQRERKMSLILITHDLGVVAQMADEVVVMYAGKVVETGSADDIFYASGHPYTQGLKSAMPQNQDRRAQQLEPIAGSPPDLFDPPTGCGYFERCPRAMQVCEAHQPPDFDLGKVQHRCACWLHDARATHDS